MRLPPAALRSHQNIFSRRVRDAESSSTSSSRQRGSRLGGKTTPSKPLTVYERLLVRQLEACSAPSSLLRLALFRSRRGLGQNLQYTRRAVPRKLKQFLALTPNIEDRPVVEAISGLASSIHGSRVFQRPPKLRRAAPHSHTQTEADGKRSTRIQDKQHPEKALFERLLRQCETPLQVVEVYRTLAARAAAGSFTVTSATCAVVIRRLDMLRSGWSEREIMSCTNALAAAHRDHEIVYSAGFCRFAALQAVRVQSTTALWHYISESHRLRYRMASSDCQRLIGELVRQSKVPQRDGTRFGAWQRRDALRLLTGWESTGVGVPGEERHSSLASFVYQDYSTLVFDYTRALAELGACEAIWHEWLAYRQGLRKKLSGAERDPAEIDAEVVADPDLDPNVVEAFREALLRAGDAARASRITLDGRSQLSTDGINSSLTTPRLTDPFNQSDWQERRDRLLGIPMEQYLEHFEKALRLNWVEDRGGAGSHVFDNKVR